MSDRNDRTAMYLYLRGNAPTFADHYEQLTTGLADRLAEIGRDARLTSVGRTHARAQAFTKASGEAMTHWHVQAEPTKRHIEAAERVLLSAAWRQRIPDGIDKDDERWIERQVSARVEAMDQHERDTLYLEACRQGDYQTVRTRARTEAVPADRARADRPGRRAVRRGQRAREVRGARA